MEEKKIIPATFLIGCNHYSFPDQGYGVHGSPVCNECLNKIQTFAIKCPFIGCNGVLTLRSTNPYDPNGGYAKKILYVLNYKQLDKIPTYHYNGSRNCCLCENNFH